MFAKVGRPILGMYLKIGQRVGRYLNKVTKKWDILYEGSLDTKQLKDHFEHIKIVHFWVAAFSVKYLDIFQILEGIYLYGFFPMVA